MALTPYIDILSQGAVLSEQDSVRAFETMMQGEADDTQTARFLSLLAQRGETIGEIYAAAKVLRGKVHAIDAPDETLDCCGTGGDGLKTLNISTAVALIAAGCGVPVAKHGNRAATSLAGAADVLEALGVRLDLPHDRLERALRDIGFCFLMAPRHHPAMKHVAAARRTLGHRTIFNLLGPLANPAGAKHQLLGVFDRQWLRPVAEVLGRLGTQRAWIVHGADGLDEISLSGGTYAVELQDGALREFILTPDDFGLPHTSVADIKGGDAAHNAAALLKLLNGAEGPYRHIALANAAGALMVASKAANLKQAVAMGSESIDKGNALKVLQSYIQFSHEEAA